MPQTAFFRLFALSRLRLALAAAAFLAIVIGITWLGADVARQIETESESRTDNAQWALSQIEVELLYLTTTADAALHQQASLDKVRLRFDILYSRLQSLRVGRVFGGLRETPSYVELFERLEGFVNRELPFIDGPDAGLRARLPLLLTNSRAVSADAREIALTGVKFIAAASDQRRADVSRTLGIASALTILLIAFLVLLLVLLLRLFRFNRMRSAQNLATLTRLDAVVSTALEALVTLDARGRIVDYNEAACQTFGFSRAEAVGADLAELLLVDPEPHSPFRPGMPPNIATQGRFRITTRHKLGHPIPVEVSISRMVLGEDTQYVAFLRDLSAQLEADRALMEARDEALAGEKAKSDLLVVMSHEIRTPLNGMIGTIELLDSTDLQPHQREYLRIMEASGKLLMHHVNDVLDIARLDSGKAPFLSGPVDLAALVREVFENQSPAAQANGNKMVFVAPATGKTLVECDGAKLRQVLLNLVGNAVKFTHNGQISVEVEHLSGGKTEIRVRDTGIGIPQADLERIFDDFVTLDASYARRASGTGLGLGIVRRIVHKMGGTLTVESRENRGSTFRIVLPLTVLEGTRSNPPVPSNIARPEGQAGRLATLVIEDNEFNRVIVREMLLKEGHDVVEARDGIEGIAVSAARRFDLILMDISMPRVDGLQAAQSIRSGKGASNRTPIVAMTAHAMAEETARFLAEGMSKVLVKPITRDALKAVLKSVTPGHSGHLGAGRSGSVLDRKALEDLAKDLGAGKASDLVAAFRSEASATVARVAALAPMAPLDQVVLRDLHRLTGGAGIFGAQALRELLSEVETAWKTEKAGEAKTLLTALQGVWLATEAAYQDMPAFAQPSSLR